MEKEHKNASQKLFTKLYNYWKNFPWIISDRVLKPFSAGWAARSREIREGKGSRKQCSDVQKWMALGREFAMNLVNEVTATPKALNAVLPAKAQGTISGLACKCSTKNDMDFLIKQNHIICGNCGREVAVLPPLLGIFKAVCSCCASPSVKTTFVLDTRGIYTCTWCGQTR